MDSKISHDGRLPSFGSTCCSRDWGTGRKYFVRALKFDSTTHTAEVIYLIQGGSDESIHHPRWVFFKSVSIQHQPQRSNWSRPWKRSSPWGYSLGVSRYITSRWSKGSGESHPLRTFRGYGVSEGNSWFTSDCMGWLSSMQRILREVHLWSKLSHDNVVRMLGISTEFNSTISIVSDWLELGDAHSYVQDTENDPRPIVSLIRLQVHS